MSSGKWNSLTGNLQWFWDLDLLRIKENEKSVNENVLGNIKLEKNGYTVKLPFKEEHPFILENYTFIEKKL